MKVVQKIDRQKWSDFVYHHPHGNIFQTPEIYEVYKNTKNYEPIFLAVVNKNNEILGVLLSVIQREYKGPIGDLTARSIIWGGPLVKNNDTQVICLILREYDKIARKKAIYSQFRNLWYVQKFNEMFNELGYSLKDYLNIIIDLKKSEDLLWKELHPKRRSQIRRASKRSLAARELKDPDSINKVYPILVEVYNNAKLPIADKSMFIAATKILAPRGMIKYFGAFYNDEIIGVRCVLAYRETLYDWYAGSLRQYYNKYPNDLLPWEVFKWGKERGYTIFDFGGVGRSDKEYGVRDYKKKFGGKFVKYGRFEKVHMTIKYKIAKIGFSLWQRIKGWKS